MSDKPILFSAPMIRALLDGRKTQTRRILRSQPSQDAELVAVFLGDGQDLYVQFTENVGISKSRRLHIGRGDRLWVRETFQTAMSDGGPCWLYRANSDRVYPEFDGPDEGAGPSFNYDRYPANYSAWAADVEAHGPWRSPIHMPRWASRLTLTVTDVRVQRLQEISDEDAVAEGCAGVLGPNPDFPDEWDPAPQEQFRGLWNAINGAGAWDANPWVAAYTFAVERDNIDGVSR